MTRTAPTVQDPFGLGLVLTVAGFAPGSAVQAFGSANRCLFVRTLNGGTISKVRIEVGTSSGNISVAAYQNTGVGVLATPTGAPLSTSGAVACPASGAADVALGAAVSLAPGDWLALSCDNITATFRELSMTTAAIYGGLACRQDTAHPAPTVGTLAVTSIIPILLGIA